MNYAECLELARGKMGNYCKACPECNGRACKNQMPGPGAKGIGDTAIRNYDKWKGNPCPDGYTGGETSHRYLSFVVWKEFSVSAFLQVRWEP